MITRYNIKTTDLNVHHCTGYLHLMSLCIIYSDYILCNF